ncbi:hypothetical protein D3C80_1265140 [compost metagenome]
MTSRASITDCASAAGATAAADASVAKAVSVTVFEMIMRNPVKLEMRSTIKHCS